MIIYIVRHPQTEWNLDKRIQGHKDSPLTTLGRDMAGNLGDLLINRGIGDILSSNLGRCVETAKVISSIIHITISYSPELRERDFGEFNGKESAYVRQHFDMDDPELIAPSGESFREMQSRVVGFIQGLDGSTDTPILIVTHEGCLRALLSKVLGRDPQDVGCNTNAMTVYEFKLENERLYFSASLT